MGGTVAKQAGPAAISAGHKAALAEGRAQGRVVRQYLEALETHRPKRGRKRTAQSIETRLERITSELVGADPLRRLQLTQERLDLANELAVAAGKVNLASVEAAFVAEAASFSARKGISWAAWREIGVPAAVLRRAGLSPNGAA